jgi:hypothetical protein
LLQAVSTNRPGCTRNAHREKEECQQKSGRSASGANYEDEQDEREGDESDLLRSNAEKRRMLDMRTKSITARLHLLA